MSGYNNPALLLHFDGTNGSTTFIDSSLNGFSFTSGGPTISTATSVFGQSGSFGGIVQTTGLAAGGPLDICSGTSGNVSFTVEGWINPNNYNLNSCVFNIGYTTSSSSGGVRLTTSGTTVGLQYQSGVIINGATVAQCPIGVWTKFSISYNAATFTLYLHINGLWITSAAPGSPIASGPFSGAASFGGDALSPVQGYWSGYLDEIRITKGACLYNNASYTVVGPFPSSPPNNYSPSFLTHMDGTPGSTTFVDSSSNVYAVTSVLDHNATLGNPTVQPTVYSPGYFSQCGLFQSFSGASGSGQCGGGSLHVATGTVFGGPLDLSTTNSTAWTVEGFYYVLAQTGSNLWQYGETILDLGSYYDLSGFASPYVGLKIYMSAGGGGGTIPPALQAQYGSNTGFVILSGGSVSTGWNYFAVTWDGTTYRLYLNGSLVNSQTVTASVTSWNNWLTIGGEASTIITNPGSADWFNGYMDEIRITKNTALYTGSTAPIPTAPFPNPSLSIVSSNFSVVPQALTPIKAPNLQVPPLEYSQKQQKDLTNQLKIYFNAVDNANHQFIQNTGSSSVVPWLNTSF